MWQTFIDYNYSKSITNITYLLTSHLSTIISCKNVVIVTLLFFLSIDNRSDRQREFIGENVSLVAASGTRQGIVLRLYYSRGRELGSPPIDIPHDSPFRPLARNRGVGHLVRGHSAHSWNFLAILWEPVDPSWSSLHVLNRSTNHQ